MLTRSPLRVKTVSRIHHVYVLRKYQLVEKKGWNRKCKRFTEKLLFLHLTNRWFLSSRNERSYYRTAFKTGIA